MASHTIPHVSPAALLCIAALAGCVGHPEDTSTGGSSTSASASAAASAGTGGAPQTNPYAMPAVLVPLTTDPSSTVAHDNELMALAPHAGALFAATDQWMYSGPSPAGQVLVKSSSSAPWKIFEQTESLRVQVLDSFAIPANQGLGAGHSLLVTQAIVNGQSQVQWMLDSGTKFTGSYPLASTMVDARSFGAHESGGVWSVYAGAEPTGILAGAWSPSQSTLVFDPTPELTVPETAQTTAKVTGFADCGGALYVSIYTTLYRRNDGALPSGYSRWQEVYQAPTPRAPRTAACAV